jgi:Mrp family chromosome partitioning ATPase
VTSTVSGEGTTTFAANLAASLATAGHRVLLVDGNGYKPQLSRLLAPQATIGLWDVLSRRAALRDLAWQDGEVTKMDFLPGGGGAVDAGRMAGSFDREALLKWCGDSYEIIVIDLPPLVPAPDVSLARNVADSFLLVVQWGRVDVSLIQTGMSAAGLSERSILGFVFNKMPEHRLKWDGFYLSEQYKVPARPKQVPASRADAQVRRTSLYGRHRES